MMLELKNLLVKNLSKANKKPIFGHTIQLRDLSSALCIMDIIKKSPNKFVRADAELTQDVIKMQKQI